MTNRKITSTDVAQLAGVSQSTVSRVFGSGAGVTDAKREKVLDAAAKLGYQPNALARGLITKKSKMVGIVMRDIQNPFYPEVLEKFYEALSEKGYHLLFINSKNENIEENEISHLIEYNVEGVIITDALLSSSAIERFTRNDIKVVLFNRYTEYAECTAVFCDNYFAGKEIGNYLINKGHRQFGFISGPLNTSTALDRKYGFEDALKRASISNFEVVVGNYTYESGFDAAKELISNHTELDCIFCGNDITAIGAIDAIREVGLKIPEDISVIGFDDIGMASWPSYNLTTWQQPIDEMVNDSIAHLFSKGDISEKREVKARIPLKGKMIERGTVKNRR